MQLFDSIVNKFFSFITLPYKNSFQCICAAILSIRTRDVVTKKVCEELFSKVSDSESFLCQKRDFIYSIINKVNYSKRKLDMLFELAKDIYRNDVPSEKYLIMKLPGVGDKVCDVYTNSFIKNVVAVDGAVFRIVARICGKYMKYSEVSMFIQNNINNNLLFAASTSIINFGRNICKPRNPLCGECDINMNCEYYKNIRK